MACKDEPELINEDEISKELLGALIAHRIHQDNLFSSRVQLLIAFQAGVLVGSFSQRDNWLGPAIMIGGGIFTFFIYLLVLKDQDDRDVNLELIDYIGTDLVPSGFKEKIYAEINNLKMLKKTTVFTKSQERLLTKFEHYEIEKRYVWFSSPLQCLPRWRRWARGRNIISLIMISVVLLDFALAYLYHYANYLFPNA